MAVGVAIGVAVNNLSSRHNQTVTTVAADAATGVVANNNLHNQQTKMVADKTGVMVAVAAIGATKTAAGK